MDFNAWLADMTGFLSRYSALFIGGLRNTLILSAIAGVLSILVGGGLCFLRMSRIAPLRWIANIWIEFVRGTPVLVQIMLVYYGLPMIGIEPPVPAFLGSAGNRVMYGIIALTINSVGRSRTDGGRALDWFRPGSFDDDDRCAAGSKEHSPELRQRICKPYQSILAGHGHWRCRADVYL